MSREKKFTPGPWWVQGDESFGYFVQAKRLKASHGYDIEILGDDHNEELYPEDVYLADCHLVAAAPELLAALESLAKTLHDYIGDADQIDMAESAIKKAYGEKP